MSKKPYPFALEANNKNLSRPNIKYLCPVCKKPLLYDQKEKYCHNCGEKLNWGVLLNINKDMFNHYMELETATEKLAFYNALNQLNKKRVSNTPCRCNNFSKASLECWKKLYDSSYKICNDVEKGNKTGVFEIC